MAGFRDKFDGNQQQLVFEALSFKKKHLCPTSSYSFVKVFTTLLPNHSLKKKRVKEKIYGMLFFSVADKIQNWKIGEKR